MTRNILIKTEIVRNLIVGALNDRYRKAETWCGIHDYTVHGTEFFNHVSEDTAHAEWLLDCVMNENHVFDIDLLADMLSFIYAESYTFWLMHIRKRLGDFNNIKHASFIILIDMLIKERECI